MEREYIMIADSEFDEMLQDLEYYQALSKMLTDI